MGKVGRRGKSLSRTPRASGTRREAIDKELAGQEKFTELPSARGCTYVVPRSHYALALIVGRSAGDSQDVATAKKFLGVTEAELEKLDQAVVDALANGPADPKQIRELVGGASRSLGEDGKKRGVTTTLPLSLGRLQNDGRIRRISTDGRLDNQRYKYALWGTLPRWLTASRLREEAFVELAKLYFKWIGPASAANFQWFSGLGVKAAKEAMAPLNLVRLEADSDLLLRAEDLESLKTFSYPKEEQVALVGSIDGLVHLRRDVVSHLGPQDRVRKMYGEKKVFAVGDVVDLTTMASLTEAVLWDFGSSIRSFSRSSGSRLRSNRSSQESGL